MELRRYEINYGCMPELLQIDVQVGTFLDDDRHCFRGIIDTGANRSIISPAVVRVLRNIASCGTVLLRMANLAPVLSPLYMCDFHIGECDFKNVFVGVLNMSDAYDIVLGTDVLQQCDMTLTNHEGMTCLSLTQDSTQRRLL